MLNSIPYDSKNVALLVIDMQETPRREVIDIIPKVQSIVKTCHEKNIPVFWTQHGHRNLEFDGGAVGRWWGDRNIKWGSEEWKILRELQPFVSRSPTSLDILDFVIKNKTRYDAFHNTELSSLLISLGIKTLIISGIETNLCCESTARRGFDQDYNIVFLKDATTTENEEMHEATLLNLGYGVAKIATVVEVIEWLDKR
ncbi:Isochorismatase-like protein [Glomus cerebriforme]|uniref:Isochorismatase-like protein n=1 Tax=Glomus cerebriforme TaxID=658196 RepID=A0A397SXM7_9GLOM|nr:Isochorismatase-like protein [Glomus cerebriforme]